MLLKIGSQTHLDEYVRDIPLDEKCHFMIEKGINLCDSEFKCRFQGRDRFRIRLGRKRECNREKVIELMKMF